MNHEDSFTKLVESNNKIVEQLQTLNATISKSSAVFANSAEDCFETLHDLFVVEKEKAAALKEIATSIQSGGLAHAICLGVRHGFFGQDASADDSL